jgi:RNA polymerase sigma-70 factor, ECF subfamily
VPAAGAYRGRAGIDDFDRVVEAARAGEEWAAAVLFRAWQPSLLRYLRWQEPAVADDVAGETWLALAEHIGHFQGDEAALHGWLFSVARRRVADHRRRGARRRTQPVDHEQLVEVEGGPDPADTAVESLSAQDAVRVITAALSPDQAEVIVLRVVAGMTTDEVAAVLGKRPGTIRVLQHRAVRRLAGNPSVADALEPGR